MKSKLWVLLLGFMLSFVPMGRLVFGQSRAAEQTAKVKTEITKRIDNGKDKVKLKLRSGEEVKGCLDQASENDFTLTDDKTRQRVTVAYADVERLEGRGLGKGAKIGIITGIVVGAAAIVLIKASRDFDPFKNGIPIRGVSF